MPRAAVAAPGGVTASSTLGSFQTGVAISRGCRPSYENVDAVANEFSQRAILLPCQSAERA